MGERTGTERLHESVYGALRLLEDNDLIGADLTRAISLADELQAELSRIREALG